MAGVRESGLSEPMKSKLEKYRGMWQDRDDSEFSLVRKEVEKRLYQQCPNVFSKYYSN